MKNPATRTFRYPGTFIFMGKLIIGLMGLVWILIDTATLLDESSRSNALPGLGVISAGCAGFIIFGIWMIGRHAAVIELGPEKIVKKNGSREISIRYDQITRVSHDSKTFQKLILESPAGRMSINRSLVDYQEMWDLLESRLPASVLPGKEEALRIKCKAYEMYICGGIFAGLSLVFVGGAWYGLLIRQIGLGMCIFVNVILVPFAALLIYLMLVYPRLYIFTHDEIQQVSLVRVKCFQPSLITGAACGQRRVGKNTRYSSRISHFVEFQMGKESICIDNGMTNFPIEGIVEFARREYGLEGKLTKAVLEKQEAV